jgi:hypothetical protein
MERSEGGSHVRNSERTKGYDALIDMMSEEEAAAKQRLRLAGLER